MLTIWKFPIPMEHAFELKMPADPHVLAVQVQAGQPTLWALVDSESPQEPYHLLIIGTGHAIPENTGRYFGTWQQDGYVWHLFEALQPKRAPRSL